jgi:hypothetical protein
MSFKDLIRHLSYLKSLTKLLPITNIYSILFFIIKFIPHIANAIEKQYLL